MKKSLLIIWCLFTFALPNLVLASNDRDGTQTPIPPTELNGENPTLLGQTTEEPQTFASPNQNSQQFLYSDDISLMSSNGGLLTLWSLQPNEWVWGYSPFDSIQLGDARIWKIITHNDGKIQIQNKKTKTCLSTFAGGVVHIPCSAVDPYQLWTINPFDNQAIQLKNVKKGTCLQTPTFRYTTYYSIYTTTCSDSTQPNLDQQWYITAPATPADHIFKLN